MTTRLHPPPNRILWLDGAKCAAILAVVAQHSQSLLNYSDGSWIQRFTCYCVPLFILVAGMTSYLSNQRHQRTWLAEFWHSSKTILANYVLATFVYQIISFMRPDQVILFDFSLFLKYLVTFSAALPFYYICLYLQLMLVSRFFYRCIEGFPERYRLPCEIAGGLVLLLFAHFSVFHTYILGIFGGGGKLLGGTYVFLYYLGMLFMKHSVFAPISRKRSLLYLAVSTPLLVVWFVVMHLTDLRLDTLFPCFGDGRNPPGVSIMVYTILFLFFGYAVFTLLQDVPCLHWLVAFTTFIGRHTLYIFLYHWILLYSLLFRLPYIPMTVLVSLTVLLLGPIAWEYIVHAVYRFFRRLQRLDA